MLRGAVQSLVNVDTRLWVRTAFTETIRRLPVWRQRALACSHPNLLPFALGYVGRPTQVARATALLRLTGPTPMHPLARDEAFDPHTGLVCDGPVPGALRVPLQLRMLVPLDRSLREITARWKMRGRLSAYAAGCETQRVDDESAVKQINHELLEPFARARHDHAAYILDESAVVRIARTGHLGLLVRDGAAIAAHLGYSYVRRGQRYWSCVRFGYPEEVFSDHSRLSDANTVNAYWAIRYAMDSGHDVFDFGTAIASPDGGLLQFKHRRSGVLSAFDCGLPFWIRLPRAETEEFLWRWPLFSLEHAGIVLNVGIPKLASNKEILTRLRPIAYRGLAVVRIRCARDLASLLPELRSMFESTCACGKLRAPDMELVDAHGV